MTEDTGPCDSCGVVLVRGQPIVFYGLGRIYRDQLEILEPLEVFCSIACLTRANIDSEAPNWVPLLWWQAGSSGRITVEGIGKWEIPGQMYDINVKGFRPAKDPVASSPTLVYGDGEGIKWPV